MGDCHNTAHHPVFKEDEKSSKLRIVFDASAKENGPSLNEVLYKGSQLTPLIFDILIRFRTYAIALTSDIKKAFHQVTVNFGGFYGLIMFFRISLKYCATGLRESF